MLTAILSHAPDNNGLNWKTVQDKFFKDMDVCVGPFSRPSRCGLGADWKVTEVSHTSPLE
jgi:hypothetical protein